jgi:hypothetical protein
LFIWRIRLPKNHTKTLLKIFLGTWIIGVSILWNFCNVNFLGISIPDTIFEYLQLSLFFISLTLFYITNYQALEVDSPSIVMVRKIGKAGSQGLDKDKFKQQINNDILIKPRLEELVAGDMVYLDDRVYKIKPKGILIASIFIMYRKLLKKMYKGG